VLWLYIHFLPSSLFSKPCSSKKNTISRSKVPLAIDSRHHLQYQLLASKWEGKELFYGCSFKHFVAMWPTVSDALTLEIQQAQGLNDMLPYFPAVTTYPIAFSTVLNMFEIFTNLDVIFLWHILYKCIIDVHPLFNWIHCLCFMTKER